MGVFCILAERKNIMNEKIKIKDKPILQYEDDWGNKVYKLKDELYVDIDDELHTIERSAGFEEPGFPIGISV